MQIIGIGSKKKNQYRYITKEDCFNDQLVVGVGSDLIRRGSLWWDLYCHFETKQCVISLRRIVCFLSECGHWSPVFNCGRCLLATNTFDKCLLCLMPMSLLYLGTPTQIHTFSFALIHLLLKRKVKACWFLDAWNRSAPHLVTAPMHVYITVFVLVPETFNLVVFFQSLLVRFERSSFSNIEFKKKYFEECWCCSF